MWGLKRNIYRTRREDLCLDCVAQDVPIGTQTWAKCNLDVDQYTDGTQIPNVSATLWATLSTGAWCYYNDDPANAKYGKLYNWYAAVGIHDVASLTNPALRKKIAPVGYKVPSNADWTTLSSTIGGTAENVGTELKEDGICHWIAPNTGTNTSGFTAFGAGIGSQFGFIFNGERTYFWSTDEFVPNTNSGGFGIFPTDTFGNTTDLYTNLNPRQGLSIRLIQETCPDCVAQNIPIGTQVWTRCNATVSTYRNGNSIPYVDNQFIWNSLTTGAWCYYNNDPSTEATYGKLYNWYAVNDLRGIAPTGWKVPTDAEWTVLTDYLGGVTVAGGKMKEVGLCHWTTPNTSATNTSLFTGLPGGLRTDNGTYGNIGLTGNWWSSTENNTFNAWSRNLNFSIGLAGTGFASKQTGYSLRFIEDPCPDCVAHTVDINGQIWTGCNANTSFYNNGDPIPYVEDNATWQGLTTGAWCYVNGDPSTEAAYGKLYNWFAVTDTLHGGIAPNGYRVPTDADWTILTDSLGGAGGPLKEEGFCHWINPNIDATNTSLFTGLPGGYRFYHGSYGSIGSLGYWWSSSEWDIDNAWNRNLSNSTGFAGRSFVDKRSGLSVRFIKEACPDVTIGDQVWTGCNLNVDRYRNGNLIPEVSDPVAWAALTTGAWCWYSNNSVNGPVYGKLYNWYAVNDPRGLAPSGYHIPTDAEWTTLTTSLGGLPIAGGKMKEVGTSHWFINVDATNSSNFTGLPGGKRDVSGIFSENTTGGYFWSSTSSPVNYAWGYELTASLGNAYRSIRLIKTGFSVRLIKD